MDGRQLVVGAIIVDSLANPTRVLAARRSRPAELAGLWEFPGGKVERGESPEEALIREVTEELGLKLQLGGELAHGAGAWPISDELEMRLFFAAIAGGEVALGDSHDTTFWLDASTLESVPWLPADREVLTRLRDSALDGGSVHPPTT